RLLFAVAPDFPRDVLPPDTGLIIADRYGGEIVRPAPEHKLAGARRKAMTLRLARVAASRLQGVIDPEGDFERWLPWESYAFAGPSLTDHDPACRLLTRLTRMRFERPATSPIWRRASRPCTRRAARSRRPHCRSERCICGPCAVRSWRRWTTSSGRLRR